MEHHNTVADAMMKSLLFGLACIIVSEIYVIYTYLHIKSYERDPLCKLLSCSSTGKAKGACNMKVMGLMPTE